MDWTRVPTLLEDLSSFAPVMGREDEGPPVFAGSAFSIESPLAAAQGLIETALEREVATPWLEAPTTEECLERAATCCLEFIESRTAYRVLMRHTGIPSIDPQEFRSQMLRRTEALRGPEGADVYDFAAETYQRSLALAKRYERLPKESPNGVRRRELRLLKALRMFADIHQCAQYVLFAASKRDHLPSAIGLECAFEIVRGSAVQAYAMARLRADLHATREVDDLSPLPFDDEDRFLANLS